MTISRGENSISSLPLSNNNETNSSSFFSSAVKYVRNTVTSLMTSSFASNDSIILNKSVLPQRANVSLFGGGILMSGLMMYRKRVISTNKNTYLTGLLFSRINPKEQFSIMNASRNLAKHNNKPAPEPSGALKSLLKANKNETKPKHVSFSTLLYKVEPCGTISRVKITQESFPERKSSLDSKDKKKPMDPKIWASYLTMRNAQVMISLRETENSFTDEKIKIESGGYLNDVELVEACVITYANEMKNKDFVCDINTSCKNIIKAIEEGANEHLDYRKKLNANKDE